MDVRLITTYLCNYNCVFCHHEGWGNVEKKEQCYSFMDVEKLMELLPSLVRCGCDSITLSGGEPCLHPRIDEIIAGIKNYPQPIKLTLVTNGVFLQKVKNIHLLDVICISIHTWDAKSYLENSGGKNGLIETIVNINHFIEHHPGLDIRINSVVDSYLLSNFSKIENILMTYRTVKLIEKFPLINNDESLEKIEEVLLSHGWVYLSENLARRKRYYAKGSTQIYLTRVFCAVPAEGKRAYCIEQNEINISPEMEVKKCREQKGVLLGSADECEGVIQQIINLEEIRCKYE